MLFSSRSISEPTRVLAIAAASTRVSTDLVARRTSAPLLDAMAPARVVPGNGRDSRPDADPASGRRIGARGTAVGALTCSRDLDHLAGLAQLSMCEPGATIVILDHVGDAVVGFAGGTADPGCDRVHLPGWLEHVNETVGLPLALDDPCSVAALPLPLAQLGAAALAAEPVRAADGSVVGSICALTSVPHIWTTSERTALADFAVLCEQSWNAPAPRRSGSHRSTGADRSGRRSRALLQLSHTLAGAVDLRDVSIAVSRAAAAALDVCHAAIWVARPTGRKHTLDYLPDPESTWPRAAHLGSVRRDSTHPLAEAFRRRQQIFHSTRAGLIRTYDALGADDGEVDYDATCVTPLCVGDNVVGCLGLAWPHARTFDDQDLLVIDALSLYTAQAVHRACLLDQRTSTAATLQRALLPALPVLDGLAVDARYRPASTMDQVGGDWYDVVPLAGGEVSLVIGDVVGHDVSAAARMGQLRSMLRTIVWATGTSPAADVRTLDRAAHDLSVGTTASLVVARLGVQAADGSRTLTWTNAGHPPPLLVRPDGTAALVDDPAAHGCLLGVQPTGARGDATTRMQPGDTLLFYTDGLVERRGEDLEDGIEALRACVAVAGGRPLADMLDQALSGGTADLRDDDVAVLAVRTEP